MVTEMRGIMSQARITSAFWGGVREERAEVLVSRSRERNFSMLSDPKGEKRKAAKC